MPNPSANPTLYGHSRPKSKPIPISHSSIYSLHTELSLAKQRLTTPTTPGRPRGEKTKSLFSSSNKGVSSRAAKDLSDNDHPSSKSKAEGSGLTDAELARSRRKMEEKTRLYEKLRKGEYVPPTKKQRRGGHEEEGQEAEQQLVDFDRKWREEGSASENHSDSESSDSEDEIAPANADEELVEYTDEFGRTRTAPKSIAEKHLRKLQKQEPNGPSTCDPSSPNPTLLHGPIIQTHAFLTSQHTSLPSTLPPLPAQPDDVEETHYNATSEIRTKGVGFYAFSTDNLQRAKEMEELEKARKKTEEERRKNEESKKRRREEIENRREEIRRRKREVVGGRWLEGLMGELEGRGERVRKEEGGEGDEGGMEK